MTEKKEKKRDSVFRLLEKSLGTATDKSIAKKVGCSASYVGKLRKYDFWKKKPLQKIAVYTEVPYAYADNPESISDAAYEMTKGGRPKKDYNTDLNPVNTAGVDPNAWTRSSVLDTAKQYVTKDREATHGDMEDNFESIGMLWEQYFSYEWTFSPTDVAVMMALLKIARLKSNKDNPDNYIDACGYMACAGELALKKVAKK